MTGQKPRPESEQSSLFDGAERNEEATTRALVDQLIADTRLYSSNGAVKELLEFTVKLREVAPFNAMLLHMQKPGISYVATAQDWLMRFRCHPKQHARPLVVLRNFGPVGFVYDIQDVEGDLPKVAFAFPTAGEVPQGFLSLAESKLARVAIQLVWVDKGDRNAGRIWIEKDFTDEKRLNAVRLEINRNHADATKFVTLAHELAHLYLGHCGNDFKRGVRLRRPAALGAREVEAETVAWLVAKRSGVTPSSESYLDDFKGDFAALDLHTIMRATNAIERLLGLPLRRHEGAVAGDSNPTELVVTNGR